MPEDEKNSTDAPKKSKEEISKELAKHVKEFKEIQEQNDVITEMVKEGETGVRTRNPKP